MSYRLHRARFELQPATVTDCTWSRLAKKGARFLFFLACCLGLPLMVWGLNCRDAAAHPPPYAPSVESPFLASLSQADWQRYLALRAKEERTDKEWAAVFPYAIPAWVHDMITVYGFYAWAGFMGYITCTEVWDWVKDLPP